MRNLVLILLVLAILSCTGCYRPDGICTEKWETGDGTYIMVAFPTIRGIDPEWVYKSFLVSDRHATRIQVGEEVNKNAYYLIATEGEGVRCP